jgi:hypothetical protein
MVPPGYLIASPSEDTTLLDESEVDIVSSDVKLQEAILNVCAIVNAE